MRLQGSLGLLKGDDVAASMLTKLGSVARFASGQFGRDLSAASRDRPVTAVLCYHRVTTDQPAGFSDIEAGVDASVFEAQMQFMLRRFRPMAAADVRADSEPGLRFAVTFDDGTSDNLDIAVPILERLGIPATFYVVTDYVGTDRLYWWEELGMMVRAAKVGASVDLHAAVAAAGGVAMPTASSYTLGAIPDRLLIIEAVATQIRTSDPAYLGSTMEAVAAALKVSRHQTGRPYGLMDWDDLRGLRARGFDIGLHTATHPNLEAASPDCFSTEILGAAGRIKTELGEAPRTFAFPYGLVRSCDQRVPELLADTDIEIGFGTGPGLLTGGEPEPFELPRCLLNNSRPAVWAHNLMMAQAATPHF